MDYIPKNYKNVGELGERIAIGELAKFGLDVALPMSDNLPFDFIIYKEGIFYKCQVKTSLSTSVSEGSVIFDLTSNNWYKKEKYKYSGKDVDIFILCDGNHIYLFKQKELDGRSTVTVRMQPPKNNQVKKTILKDTVIISEERLRYIFKD